MRAARAWGQPCQRPSRPREVVLAPLQSAPADSARRHASPHRSLSTPMAHRPAATIRRAHRSASREGGSDARQRARQAIRDMAAATAIDALDSGSSDALVVAAAAAVLISELDTDTDEPAAEGAAAQPHKRARSGASAPGT